MLAVSDESITMLEWDHAQPCSPWREMTLRQARSLALNGPSSLPETVNSDWILLLDTELRLSF